MKGFLYSFDALADRFVHVMPLSWTITQLFHNVLLFVDQHSITEEGDCDEVTLALKEARTEIDFIHNSIINNKVYVPNAM